MGAGLVAEVEGDGEVADVGECGGGWGAAVEEVGAGWAFAVVVDVVVAEVDVLSRYRD